MMTEHTAENGLPGWYRPFPDLTTETIQRIDAELARTQGLNREVLCLTCGERGVHAHFIPPGSTNPSERA